MKTIASNKQIRNKIGLYFINEEKPDPRLDPTIELLLNVPQAYVTTYCNEKGRQWLEKRNVFIHFQDGFYQVSTIPDAVFTSYEDAQIAAIAV